MVLSGSQVFLQKLTLGSWAPTVSAPHPLGTPDLSPCGLGPASTGKWFSDLSSHFLGSVRSPAEGWLGGALAPTPHTLALRVDLRWVRKLLPYRNGLTSAHWGSHARHPGEDPHNLPGYTVNLRGWGSDCRCRGTELGSE